MDRGAWRATAHGIAEPDTTEHTHTSIIIIALGSFQGYQILPYPEKVPQVSELLLIHSSDQ